MYEASSTLLDLPVQCERKVTVGSQVVLAARTAKSKYNRSFNIEF